MKIWAKSRRAGFTLIELMAVLVLGGMTLVFVAMLTTTSTNLYMDSKYAIEDSQKIQVAMSRLVKELTFAAPGTVATTNARTVQWTLDHPDRPGESLMATWDGTSGSDLNLGGITLLNNVGSFSVTTTADTVNVSIQSSRSLGVVHSSTIHPLYGY